VGNSSFHTEHRLPLKEVEEHLSNSTSSYMLKETFAGTLAEGGGEMFKRRLKQLLPTWSDATLWIGNRCAWRWFSKLSSRGKSCRGVSTDIN